VTQAVCDLALRFGESARGEESIMVKKRIFSVKKKKKSGVFKEGSDG